MWSRLSRHLFIPAHERLLGRKTTSFFRELGRSQWWAPDDLRELQRAKLRALLRHAVENTAFYRQRIRSIGADPKIDDPVGILSAVPPLTKDEIREHAPAMTWRRAPGGLIPLTTGGSTGRPLQFVVDRRRQAYDQAARLRAQRWYRVEVGEAQLYLWGSPIESASATWLRRQRDVLFNHRLVSAFDMSPQRLEQYVNVWNRFRPVSLFGYPSSIALFARFMQSRGLRIDKKRLRAVFVTGEVCLPEDRALINDVFGVPVANGYGSREGGFVAHECPEGGMHITAENIVVEVLPDPPDRGGNGAAGELAVTHLDAYTMPFIRYRTGDLGRLRSGRCRCGRGLPMLQFVDGRCTDFLYLPDGTVQHALSVIYPLRELAGVRQFRVQQRKDFAVSVQVVRDSSTNGLTLESIHRSIRPIVKDLVPVQVHFVDTIPSTGSGKYRYVESAAGPSRRRTNGMEVAPTHV